MNQYKSLALAAATAAIMVRVATADWNDGNFGEFYFCPEGQAAIGFCTSGSDSFCLPFNPRTVELGCMEYGLLESTSDMPIDLEASPSDESVESGMELTQSKEYFPVDLNDTSAGTPGLNGWLCGAPGDMLECPPLTVIVGFCASGEDKACDAYCPSPEQTAIKCAPSAEPIGPVEWSPQYRYPGWYECDGSNYVACGLCQSGSDPVCQGSDWRIGCCSRHPDYNIVGHWLPISELIAPTMYGFSVGTKKTSTTTEQSAWSHSVTMEVSAGFSVEGIGGAKTTITGEISKSLAKSDSHFWSVSVTQQFQMSFNGTKHQELWQWVYDIADPYGNQVTTFTANLAITDSIEQMPRCLPGYGLDDSYQECLSGGELPGTRRRQLRGQSSDYF